MNDLIRLILSGREVGDNPPEWIQMVPPGHIKPSGRPDFLVDAAARKVILAEYGRKKTELAIDYEHQTLKGVEAPAAGWIKELADRGDGETGGIWARVEWTGRAVEYLKAREYRYMSPVVLIRKSDKRAVAIIGAGMTNLPAIDGMVPVVNKAEHGLEEPADGKENRMLEWLKKALGLDDSADDAAVQEAFNALHGSAKKAFGLLGLKATATGEEVEAAIEALKAPTVPGEIMEALELKGTPSVSEVKGTLLALKRNVGNETQNQTELAALKAEVAGMKAADLVAVALKDGKITPAMEPWARDYATRDQEGFIAYCKNAVPVIPNGQVAAGGGAASGGAGGLSGEELAVCKQLSIKPDDYKKTKAQREGGDV